MADSASKKAKVMPQAPRDRVRSTFQLEVEADQKWRLDRVKSHIQRIKDILQITSRTPMGNVLMMERLLDSFEESEQRRMASASYSTLFPSSSFHHHDYKPSPLTCNAETQTDCNPTFCRSFCPSGRIRLAVLISTQQVSLMRVILLHQPTP